MLAQLRLTRNREEKRNQANIHYSRLLEQGRGKIEGMGNWGEIEEAGKAIRYVY